MCVYVSPFSATALLGGACTINKRVHKLAMLLLLLLSTHKTSALLLQIYRYSFGEILVAARASLELSCIIYKHTFILCI